MTIPCARSTRRTALHMCIASLLFSAACPHSQLRIHYNKWAARFDEDIHRHSFRLAPLGSRSTSTTGAHNVTPWKKGKEWTCVYVPGRRTVRVKIDPVVDWCIDFSVPTRPLLWLISEHAWYLVSLKVLRSCTLLTTALL
jgi:hypothetical protein